MLIQVLVTRQLFKQMRDHERGGEDLRPLSESSSFCGAAGDHTPPSFCGASGDRTRTSFSATGEHTPPSVRFRPRSGTRSKQVSYCRLG
jgi:hypothetical protein